MTEQYGRSLIELIGVMAIGAVMMAGAIGAYAMIRDSQKKTVASAELEQIVKNTKLLMEMRGDYNGVSVDYLVAAGALDNTDAPIGDNTWSVDATIDGLGFEINLNGLSFNECAHFTTAIPKWATTVVVNGVSENPGSACFSSQTNQLKFIVE